MIEYPLAMRSTVVRFAVVASALVGVTFISGCAQPSASSNVYTYSQAQREQVVRVGTVTGVRPIVIKNDATTGAGMVAGGALGGVAGNSVGGGNGRTLAIVGGAILGALAGNAVEDQTGRRDGLEITVRLDNGEMRVIAQEGDIPIVVGQRVQLVSGAGPRRVTPMPTQ